MSKGAPFTADWLGTSPLHLTAQYGRYETTEVLLRAGCSRDARTKVDKTPLHVAAYEGHVDICRLLLKSGAEVDARDILLMTPLHWAVERANIKCIEVLLKHGADPDAQSKFDKSPSDISNDIGRPDLANILQTCESSNITVLEPGELQTVSNFSVINVTRSNQNLSKQDEVKIVKNGAETLTVHLDPVQIALSSAGGISSQDMETQALINSLPDLADTTSTSNSHEQNDTYRLLEAHGIKILPEEEITQTLSLTEAGKLYLSSMPSPTSQFILPDPPPPNESHNEASDEVGLVESNHDNNEEDSPEEIVMIEPKIYQAPVVVSSSSFKSIRSPLNTISISGAGNKMGITKRASYDNNTGNSVSLASRVGSQTTSTSYSRISSSGPVLLRRDNDKTISKPTVLNNIKLSKVMTLSQKESSLSLTNASIDKPRIIKLSGQQFASLKSSSNLNKIVLSPPLSHSPSASLITTTSSLVTSSIGVTGVVSSSSLRGSNSALGRIGVTGLSTSSQGSGSANSLGSIPMKRHTEGISLQPARKIQRIDDSEELKELKLKLSLELKEIERLKQELRERENNADRLQNQIKHLTNSC